MNDETADRIAEALERIADLLTKWATPHNELAIRTYDGDKGQGTRGGGNA